MTDIETQAVVVRESDAPVTTAAQAKVDAVAQLTMKAYHFTGDTLRNGRPIPAIGEWLEHEGPLKPCASGLHGSEHPFDALQYAPGNRLHLVELDGDMLPHGAPVDKYVARRRKILASVNATELLRKFARRCALDVLPLWKDAPPVVKQYLETGDERIREEARNSAAYAAAANANAKYRRWFKEMVEEAFANL